MGGKVPEGREQDSAEVMTVAEIASYLKVSQKTIFRMAKAGRIPGAKVSNQWRFLRSVIDDWLGERMQSAAKEDLLRVLETQGEEVVPISRLVSPDRVVLDMAPGAKESVLRRLVTPLVSSEIVRDGEAFLRKLVEREEMVSTAVGHGVALPHVRDAEDSGVRETCIVLGVCREGTDFESLDGGKTYVFTLLCTTSEVVHLRLMAKVSLIFREPEAVKAVRSAATIEDVMLILMRADAERQSLMMARGVDGGERKSS
jgi:PTS system nitrogen regulatory IIA component